MESSAAKRLEYKDVFSDDANVLSNKRDILLLNPRVLTFLTMQIRYIIALIIKEFINCEI